MDSHPFMSIHPLIPMIELFLNLIFKIQGQSHSSRSHNRYNILSPHIPFIPCWSALLFLRCSYLKNWPWKSKVKVMGEVKVQSHNVSVTSYRLASLLFHVNLAYHCWVTTFFKIWPWNSRVKVIDEVTVQRHNVGITSYRLTSLSFHVNRPSHSWDTAFSKFDLENQGSMSWVRSQFKSQWGSNILSTDIPFVPCQSGILFLSYDFFKIWPWKPKVKVMGEVTVQSRNVGLASYRLTSLSFHVNRPSHSWNTAFSKFDLENQGSRSNYHDVAQLQLDNSIALWMV